MTVALDELCMCVHVKKRPNVNALVFVPYEDDIPPQLIFGSLGYNNVSHTRALSQPPLDTDLRTVGSNSMGVPLLHESICSFENYTNCCLLP